VQQWVLLYPRMFAVRIWQYHMQPIATLHLLCSTGQAQQRISCVQMWLHIILLTCYPPPPFCTWCPPALGCTAAPRLPSADAQAQAAEAARQVAAAQVALQSDGPVLSASATDASAPKLGPQDFEILKVVGQGAFGKVRGHNRHRGGSSTGSWRG
jgi:hypothetical protein